MVVISTIVTSKTGYDSDGFMTGNYWRVAEGAKQVSADWISQKGKDCGRGISVLLIEGSSPDSYEAQIREIYPDLIPGGC